MKKFASILFSGSLVLSSLVLHGCASRPSSENNEPIPLLHQEQTKTILVVPPINASTSSEASNYYLTTIARPLSNHGYYVIPIEVTSQMLQEAGIIDGSQIKEIPQQKYRDLFGADAVLFVKITEWDTSYFLVAANVRVSLEFELISTKSNEILWNYKDSVIVDTSGGNGDLLSMVISTAINTANTDYVPIAMQVNNSALRSMPLGPYRMQELTEESVVNK
ncbi:MAG: GNA1162 family protein [Pseudomonadota bacterium]